MSAISGQAFDEANIDSSYLQFVVGLLDDSDNFGDFVGRERADSITEFLKRERADSLSDFIKRDRQDSITDFLPKQSDFLMRDRAYSWDLNMEEQMHTDISKARGIASISSPKDDSSSATAGFNSEVTASSQDKKRKLETKATSLPTKATKLNGKSPLLPSKSGSKVSLPQSKTKPFQKSHTADATNAKRPKLFPPPSEDKNASGKTVQNTEPSKMVPGAVLGQMVPHALTHNGPSLTRYDPISVHLLEQAGSVAGLHSLDSSGSRIGAYTKEERQAIIAKFRAKKMRRVWRKQIKYDCRKRLADTRPRVKGRFVSRKAREQEAAARMEGEAEIETASGDGDYEDDE